jgi:DNA-binding CsgD family transcriptional regulator
VQADVHRAVLAHWPLVGRNREVDDVTALFTGPPQPGLTLAGKSGVGKSRLAREAVEAATKAGWAVRVTAATATGRSIPLSAFAQWVADAEGAPLVLARNVLRALTADTEAGRLLVFVDDAHLLDDLSALVLHQLVQARTATVILTIRSGAAAPDAVTALWKDGPLRRLDLVPLSCNEIHELLTAVFGVPPDRHCADRMWQLTGGNVLYLRHLVEQEHREDRLVVDPDAVHWLGDGDVSTSLAELVDAQIGVITDEVSDVVDLVAVAQPIEWRCLRRIAAQAAIEEAERRGLIRTSADLVYVGHPLYAEVRLQRCGPLRTRRLRGQAAMAMQEATGSANAVRRGLLWLDSDLPPDAEVLSTAATAASSLLDFATAERLLTAIDDTEGAAADPQSRLHLAYNLLMMRRGEHTSAVIDDIGTDGVSPSLFLNDVVLRAANLLWTMRDPDESWRVIDEALESAHGARRHQLLAFRANQLALAARPGDVAEVMAQVDYATLDAFGAAIGLCAESLAFAELGKPEQAVAKALDCYGAVEQSGQGTFLGQPLVEFHAFGLVASGRVHEGLEVARGHLRAQRDQPDSARTLASAIVGMAALWAGDLDAALSHLPDHVDGDRADFSVAFSFHRFHLLRAQALARAGDPDAAEAALQTARAHRHPAYEYVRSTEGLTDAWLAAARQRPTEARQLARNAADFARAHQQWAREVWCLQTAVQFDDTDARARLAELATFVEGPRAGIAARYAAALNSDDGTLLEQVSADFETMGDPLAAADAAGQAATSHRRAGRTGSALTAAARAARLAAACGGATSPAIAAASLTPPFTHREREIAVLVAKGLSNREVAEAVSLSVRTVEGHIYRASTKAGVAGRSGLADVIRALSR